MELSLPPLKVVPDPCVSAILSPGQSLTLGLARVHCKYLVKLVLPGPNLQTWLDPPFLGEFRHTGLDHLAHRVPRYPQISANLLDWLYILTIRSTNLRNRLYTQHPTLCSR